ncbi:NADH-quinone oxidoreductase subunit J [Parapedobacter sp. GCM10030251]|uniref:NADH-quinone oxidoreductase subunit J family protein n=1 Tax=Parapedobacter sp. GCM10030251 TaxID=3273419 RepID=UPI0036090FD0
MDQIPGRKGGGQKELMSMTALLFYGFATVAIASAWLLVSIRNIARSLFLFFIVLFSVAGLYVFALADFVAITQILVYVGGVLVLMLFAFMLSNKELLKDLQVGVSHFFALPAWQSAVIAASFLAVLIYTSLQLGAEEPSWISASREKDTVIMPTDQTIQHIGIQLMTRYLLPFEIVSVLLMAALIGAAHLTRKEAKP